MNELDHRPGTQQTQNKTPFGKNLKQLNKDNTAVKHCYM